MQVSPIAEAAAATTLSRGRGLGASTRMGRLVEMRDGERGNITCGTWRETTTLKTLRVAARH
eukprot:9845817-Alexandrium_andersonii.AAC.1